MTVTTPAEARIARDAGADALVVQGVEAGGHRAVFDDDDAAVRPRRARARCSSSARRSTCRWSPPAGWPPARAVAAVLAAGAAAAQLGTAFMRTPEAGTADVHREALAGEAPTALTRAFSGRTARGVVNRFMREHSEDAPRAYPEVHHVTAPLRAAARERGDAGRPPPVGRAGARAGRRRSPRASSRGGSRPRPRRRWRRRFRALRSG